MGRPLVPSLGPGVSLSCTAELCVVELRDVQDSSIQDPLVRPLTLVVEYSLCPFLCFACCNAPTSTDEGLIIQIQYVGSQNTPKYEEGQHWKQLVKMYYMKYIKFLISLGEIKKAFWSEEFFLDVKHLMI